MFFLFIQKNQLVQSAETVVTQTEQNLNLGNFYHVNKGLNQLVNLGLIECVILNNKDSGQEILRLNNEILCNGEFVGFWTKKFDLNFSTIDGNHWNLIFNLKSNHLFVILFWVTIIFGLFVLNSLIMLHNFRMVQQRRIADIEIKAIQKIAELGKQVAHDIRSPLSALAMIAGNLNEISEDKRILIRNATQRINDIANDLLQRSNNPLVKDHQNTSIEKQGLENKTSIFFIPALIDMLVSEKRMQYREYLDLDIEVELKNSLSAFSEVNSNELKRVVSNLVNNSVEAMTNRTGKIIVGVRKIDLSGSGGVEVFIKDNGKGIPRQIIEKLGQSGVTYGKENTASGSGLGIYHAKKSVESFGGKLIIDSTEMRGTTVKILLPLAESPSWFANKIQLTGKKFLVSLDDDISIHQIWGGRLASVGFADIEHIKFQSGDAFSKYVLSNINRLKETLFLIDFELLNQNKTGLDLIDELGIEKYSVLVTSRYEEEDIQIYASRLRLSILPKALAGFVPFENDSEREYYDWVLIDDDELVHMTWELAAKELNKKFIGFKTPADFNNYKKDFFFDQKIFIDSSLGDGLKGEDFARDLFNQGFNCLFLATGFSSEHFPDLYFIKAVIGKEPPIGKTE